MKKKILLGIIVVALLILPMTGCATAVTPKQMTEALDKYVLVTDLSSKLKGYATSGDLTDLEDSITVQLEEAGVGVVTQEDWDDLVDRVDKLEGENTTLKNQIKALQSSSGGSSTPSPSEEYLTTRWTVDAEFDPILSSSKYEVDMSWYPTRIKDEDTYRFSVDVTAIGTGPWPKQDVDALWISLTSTSRDTSIDTSNTGIYSVSPIGIWWDSEYSPSSGVDCRSMVFVSDSFEIPVLATVGDTYTIRFDFDLYYDY